LEYCNLEVLQSKLPTCKMLFEATTLTFSSRCKQVWNILQTSTQNASLKRLNFFFPLIFLFYFIFVLSPFLVWVFCLILGLWTLLNFCTKTLIEWSVNFPSQTKISIYLQFCSNKILRLWSITCRIFFQFSSIKHAFKLFL